MPTNPTVTLDLYRLRAVLAHVPYTGSVVPSVLSIETEEDVLNHLAAVVDRLENVAADHAEAETRLRGFTQDVAALRRLLGTA